MIAHDHGIQSPGVVGELGLEPATLPTANIYNASSVDEIRSSLDQLAVREASVTARLDDLLASQKLLARQLARLDLARATLGSQVVATRDISNSMLGNASATALRISSAVKKLDREQAAVKSTLEVVEQVAELKSCVLGAHGSMGAPQDWETAATYIHRANQIPDSVIDGAFAEEIVPTVDVPDSPRITLNNASEALCTLFLREFEKASREGDGAGVTRFFKLFPLINRRDIGLDAYGKYVCTGIAARARSNFNTSQKADGMVYASALTKLFEHIAQIVEGHEPLVERHYGTGSMIKVIERIQMEADVQGGIVLDTWSEERKVARKLTDVKAYPFNFLVSSFAPTTKSTLPSRTGSPAPSSGRQSEDDSVDMKEIDSLLSEGALMLSRWSLYTRFLASKTTTSGDDDEGQLASDPLHLPPFITDSALHKKVTSLLIDPFNTLASFFLRRNVEKAFQLDENPSNLTLNPNKPLKSNPPYITSAVDDIMYIANQIIQRALATHQKPIVNSVASSAGRVLGGDFFGMIQRKMRDEAYPKPAIQGALPPENLIIAFIVQINNLDVASSYIHRIVQQSLGQNEADNGDQSDFAIKASFPFENDSTIVTRALHSLESSFTAKLSQLQTEALDVLLKAVMRPRLRPVLLETFRDMDYALDNNSNGDARLEDDFDDPPAGSEGDITSRFARGWHAFTLPVKRLLTPTPSAELTRLVLSHLASQLEKRLWALHGRITERGAVKLERDIAGIVSVATSANAGGAENAWRYRGMFRRCVQIVEVLGMEEEEWEEVERELRAIGQGAEGVADADAAEEGEWVLSSDERKRARALLVK